MTIKLPSFPRELVGSDRLLSLSLSPRFFLSPRWRETIFFFIFPYRSSPTTVGPLDRLEKRGWKVCEAIPPLLSLSLSPLRSVSVSILSGKKRKTSVDYYPRHIGSRAAAGETTWSVVTIDSIEIRDPGAGAASMEMFSLFFFLFFFI